jgi:hypothetical protein
MARLSKYKPEFCEMLIEHMMSGFTFGSFAAVAKVNRDTIFSWANTHEDFAIAKSLGEAELQYHDEKLLKDIIRGKVFGGNITGLIFKFKNCHGWRDKHPEETDRTVINVSAEEMKLKEEVKKLDSSALLKIVKDYRKKAT